MKKLIVPILTTVLLVLSALPLTPKEDAINTPPVQVQVIDNFKELRKLQREVVPEEPQPQPVKHIEISRGSSNRRTITLECTAYVWSGYRTASGKWPSATTTVATNKFPIGTRIYIPGIGERIVEDHPDAKTELDIFMASKQEALKFGRQKLQITVLED